MSKYSPPFSSNAENSFSNLRTSKSAFLDLINLANQQPLAQFWIEQLLQNEIDFEIQTQVSSEFHPLLVDFHTDQNNQLQKYGYSFLNLCFPIFSVKSSTVIRNIPLIIWPVYITPLSKSKSWGFKTLDLQPYVNPYLYQFLENNIGETPDFINEENLQISKALNTIIELLRANLRLIEVGDLQNIASLTLDSNIPKTGQGTLHWSAAIFNIPSRSFGNEFAFHHQQEENEKSSNEALGLYPLPPIQEMIFQKIYQQKHSIVHLNQDLPTNLLINIFTYQLSNSNNILYLSKDLSDLQNIATVLENAEISSLVYQATNLLKPTYSLTSSVKQDLVLPHSAKSQVYNLKQYNSLINRVLYQKKSLDKIHVSLQTELFKSLDLSNTIGLYSTFEQEISKELLESQLNEEHYTFTIAEYEELLGQVKKMKAKFEQIRTLAHPLLKIHPTCFKSPDFNIAFSRTEQLLDTNLKQLNELQHSYINLLSRYGNALKVHFDSIYDDLALKTYSLKHSIEKYNSELGKDFELTSLSSLKMISAFSNKHKRILNAKTEINTAYHNLINVFQLNAYFDFEFDQPIEKKNINKLLEELHLFSIALEKWHHKLPIEIRYFQNRLSSKNVHPKMPHQSEIEALEKKLQTHIKKLNEDELLEQTYRNVMLTTLKQKQYLEEIIADLRTVKAFMKEFEQAHDWQHHWLNLKDQAKELIKSLTILLPEDWEMCFKSWFLYYKIQSIDRGLPSVHSLDISNYSSDLTKLRSLMPQHIIRSWMKNRTTKLNQWKKENRLSYNAIMGDQKPKEKEALELYKTSAAYSTKVCPIWLATPMMIQQIPSASNPLFDLIIIEEANALEPALLQSLAQKGKRVVFLEKSSSQTNNSRSEWMRSLTKHHFSLNKTTAKEYPALIHAESQLLSFDGRYDEDQKTNTTEAEKILLLLNAVEPNEDNNYPSISIITSTYEQRNLIANYLLDIIQNELPGYEKIKLLKQFGLKFFAIDEAPFPAADELLLSLVYGSTDIRMNLSVDIDQLESTAYEASLSRLLSNHKGKLQIIHSLPPNIQEELKERTSLIAKVFDVITNTTSKKEKDLEASSDISYAHLIEVKNLSADDYFIKEVLERLKPFTKNYRLNVYTSDTEDLQIIILHPQDNEKQTIGILPNGLFSTTPITDYTWEHQQLEYFSKHEIKIIPVYALDWWKSPEAVIQTILEEL
ncbi:MAG: hypothetical protein AAFO07_16640 [Bacteroidota bacterium]